MGVVCPLGSTKDSLWDGLRAGRSGVGPLEMLSGGNLPVAFGAQARQFRTDDIECFGNLEKERKKAIRKGLKMMCREIQMGLAVGQLALEDSAGVVESLAPERIGVDFGSDYMLTTPEDFVEAIRGCLDEQGQFDFSDWAPKGMPKMTPLWLLRYLPNMPASHLAIYNDLRGPNNSLTLREAAANAATTEALQVIRRGCADAMVAGATGTRLAPLKLLHTLQQEELANGAVEPNKASRPFDLNRTGAVLGEGAGAVVLEALDAAQKRGATIYGELVAGASCSSAGPKLAAHRGRAMANVLRCVMEAASTTPDEIGHVHAHGLSTRTCDAEEAAAIQQVFAARKTPVPVVAAKSYFGNLGAGSGLVELIASVMALRAGTLFPVLNYQTPDPQCPVAAVTDLATPAGASFINLSVTPQGQASAVLVRRFEG
jgi:3-oxoacyl-[acyl-carrier-protein] synthase II